MENELPAKAKPRLTAEQWDEKNREWSRQHYEKLYETLNDENTVVDELVRIGAGYIPMDNLVPLSRLLVSHPNLTAAAIARIVEVLHALWWGEDPTACRLTWECIEKCYSEWQESNLTREDWLKANGVSISSFKYVPLAVKTTL